MPRGRGAGDALGTRYRAVLTSIGELLGHRVRIVNRHGQVLVKGKPRDVLEFSTACSCGAVSAWDSSWRGAALAGVDHLQLIAQELEPEERWEKVGRPLMSVVGKLKRRAA